MQNKPKTLLPEISIKPVRTLPPPRRFPLIRGVTNIGTKPITELPEIRENPKILPNIRESKRSKLLEITTKESQKIQNVEIPSHRFFNLPDNFSITLIWNRRNRPIPRDPDSSYVEIGCIGYGDCFFHATSKALDPIYGRSYTDYQTITENELREYETAVNETLFNKFMFNQERTPNGVYQIADKNLFNKTMEDFRIAYAKKKRKDLINSLNTDYVKDLIYNYLEGLVDMMRIEAKEREKRNITDIDAVDALIIYLQDEINENKYVPTHFIPILSILSNIDIYLLRKEDLEEELPNSTVLYGGDSVHKYVYGPSKLRSKDDFFYGFPDRKAIVLISINDNHYELVGLYNKNLGNKYQVVFDQDEPLIITLYTILKDFREKFRKL